VTAQPFVYRILGALFLRPEAYQSIAEDADGWRPATAIVSLAALAYYGSLAEPTPGLLKLVEVLQTWILVLFIVFGILRWFLFTAVVYLVAKLLARQSTPQYPRLLRCLGFAQAPAILALLAYVIDPRVVLLLPRFVLLWLLAATVVAVRAGLGTSWTRAAVVGVIGFAIDACLPMLAAMLLFSLT
jgi:Yip1 domain